MPSRQNITRTGGVHGGRRSWPMLRRAAGGREPEAKRGDARPSARTSTHLPSANDNKTGYRAKIAADMPQTSVLIEDSVLLDHILALPPNIPLLRRSTERKKSPFADLEHADGTMPEAQVSALFVRVISMFCSS